MEIVAIAALVAACFAVVITVSPKRGLYHFRPPGPSSRERRNDLAGGG